MLVFLRRLVLVSIICAASIASVHAQTTDPTQDPPKKRAAIQELLKLIGATQVAKSIFVSLIDQYSQALARDSLESFEKRNWPPSLKAKTKELAQDFFTRLSQRLREEVPQRIQMEDKLDRLYLDLYDEYFTEGDIQELLAFYRSPIGRKFLELVPKSATTLQQRAMSEVQPQILSVTRQIVSEEIEQLEKRAAAELKRPPRGKKG